MSLFMYGTSPEMRETEGKLCGKNLGMEMREILRGKNRGMEMSLFMYGILRKWGKLRENHDVSLIGNGTWKKSANKKFKQS